MSQFDSLLDFGDSTPSETNGKAQETEVVDEFDPFRPSPTIESKGTVDGNLLVDFTADSEISNGTKENGTSEPFELSFDVSASDTVDTSVTADADVTTADSSTDVNASDTAADMSSNPLYNLKDEPASNPLYEFESHTVETTVVKSSSSHSFDEPSNPLYELSEGDKSAEPASSNPLYDLMSNGNSGFDENVMLPTQAAGAGGGDIIVQTVTTTESHYENADEFGDKSGGDLIQTREIMEEFETREITAGDRQGEVTQDDQLYVEMSCPGDQADNLMDEYEFVPDTNSPEYRNASLSPEQVREKTPEQVREPTPEPIKEMSPEPIREPTPEPVREPTPEPVREPTPEPVREPTPEPVREPTPEPVREPTPEPVREPTPELMREPTPEPVREPTPEPVREPTPEPPQEVHRYGLENNEFRRQRRDIHEGFPSLETAVLTAVNKTVAIWSRSDGASVESWR